MPDQPVMQLPRFQRIAHPRIRFRFYYIIAQFRAVIFDEFHIEAAQTMLIHKIVAMRIQQRILDSVFIRRMCERRISVDRFQTPAL